MKSKTITTKFSKFIPDVLEDDTLYVSLEYCTSAHKCPCRCGEKVVIPINDSNWKLEMNREKATLTPSIGNRFACKSHYFIRDGMFVPA